MCIGKGTNAHLDLALVQDSLAAGIQGGSGGDDVIHEQNMVESLHGLGLHLERPLNVIPSFHPVLPGLGIGFPYPLEGMGQGGNAKHFAKAATDFFRLVITPFLFPLQEKGQGQEGINIPEAAAG